MKFKKISMITGMLLLAASHTVSEASFVLSKLMNRNTLAVTTIATTALSIAITPFPINALVAINAAQLVHASVRGLSKRKIREQDGLVSNDQLAERIQYHNERYSQFQAMPVRRKFLSFWKDPWFEEPSLIDATRAKRFQERLDVMNRKK